MKKLLSIVFVALFSVQVWAGELTGGIGSSGGGGGLQPSGTFNAGDIVIGGSATTAKDSLFYGTNGGISLSGGGVPTFLCFFSDISSPTSCTPENARIRNRLFVGNAALMADTTANSSVGTFFGTTPGPSFVARDAETLSMTDAGTVGIAGITQTANTVPGHASIGISGVALNNAAGNVATWAGYNEAQHGPTSGSVSSSYAYELDCRNAFNVNYTSDPYTFGHGCYGIWLAGGGGPGYGANAITTTGSTSTSSPTITVASVPGFVTAGQTVYDATTSSAIGVVSTTGAGTITLVSNAASAVGSGDVLNIQFPPNAAMEIVPNLTPWNEGIVFGTGSVTPDAVGNAPAIMMPSGYGIQWFTGSGTRAGTITSQAANKINLGGLDSATPAVQTLQGQSTLAGTSNTAGGGLGIAGGQGTGTGTGGNVCIEAAQAGSTGSAQNALTNYLCTVTAAGALVVNNSGTMNVGNNVSTPKFEIFNNSVAGNNGIGIYSFNSTATPASLYLSSSKNSAIGGHTALASGNPMASIIADGDDGTHPQDSAQILGEVDGAVSTGIVPGRWRFLTANSSGTMTEAFRVDSTQLIQIAAAGIAANGSVATLLGSVGPVGSHTTVQEWFQIKGTGGAIRWVPGF